ncbi:MAG TPA: hypothetical protein VFF65_07400 [Phycisphaerales bacterium]|nr:hypothetical protein [Phycisphaerales bacterium]
MSNRLRVSAAVAACALPCAASLAKIAIGTSNNFNNGETGNWSNGAVTDPIVLPGGPAAPTDPYLRVSSDGSGAGGKLTVFNNGDDWTGLWLTAGITHVEMDFRNFDPQGRTLHMRMGFLVSAGQGQPGWCTAAFAVPADGQWHHAVFTISEATMTRVGNAFDWETALQWVTQVRIFHSTNPSVVGTNFASSVGIDNIIALPGPGAAAVLLLGSAAALRRRR